MSAHAAILWSFRVYRGGVSGGQSWGLPPQGIMADHPVMVKGSRFRPESLGPFAALKTGTTEV